MNKDRAWDVVDAMRPIAQARDVSVAQVALAWLLHRSSVMLPIPGTRSVAHLEENVAAGALRLEPAQVEKLDAAA